MSTLTEEQKRRIDENRQRALAIKAAREAQARSQQDAAAKDNLSPPAKIFKPNPSVGSGSHCTPLPSGPSSSFTKRSSFTKDNSQSWLNTPAVTGKCVLIDRVTFMVEMPYHAKSIEVFKTIPSRKYDTTTRRWSFALADHGNLMGKLNELRPNVSIAPIPLRIVQRLTKSPHKPAVPNVSLGRVEPYLVANLMPFQKDGVCFGISKGGRCLIADDMGLGKTIQALGIASHFSAEWPLLIVTPSSMKYSWSRDVIRWLPGVRPTEVNVIDSKKDSMVGYNVIVMSYDLFARRVDELIDLEKKGKKIGVAIMDEAHMLKNSKTNRTQAAKKLLRKVQRVILLSGTPALSRPIELHPQLDLLDHVSFGNYRDFGFRYCNGKEGPFGLDFSGSSNMAELQILMEDTVMIRRLKSEVLDQLPAKERQVILLDPSTIDKPTKEMKTLASQVTGNQLKGMEKRGKLLEYFNETGVAKLKAVCKYVSDLIESGNKFLVFAHHAAVLNGLEDMLKKGENKTEYIRIDGRTPPEKRKALCEQFQDRESVRVALLSITAANTGLTLTQANLVVFAELYWNPGVLTQAEDRAHRIGQQDCVFVQYLVAAGTADDHLWPMVQSKLDVLSKAGLSKDNFSNADLIAVPTRDQTTIDDFFEALMEGEDADGENSCGEVTKSEEVKIS